MTELFERYKKACDFTQEVQPNEIIESLIKKWLSNIEYRGEIKIVRLDSLLSKEAAREAAWEAREAWESRAAWEAWAAAAAWEAAAWEAARAAREAREAWEARAARAAREVRAARAAREAWDITWCSRIVIGAEELSDIEILNKWMPFLELAEAGCWFLLFGKDKVWWFQIPRMTLKNNRCHNETGPAFILPDEQLYFLNGVLMESWMVETPANQLDAKKCLAVTNTEQRRELVRKIGVERLLSHLKHKIIHKEGDYELLSINFSEDLKNARVLKMRNPSLGVWHLERVEDGIGTVEAALNWRNGDSLVTEVLT